MPVPIQCPKCPASTAARCPHGSWEYDDLADAILRELDEANPPEGRRDIANAALANALAAYIWDTYLDARSGLSHMSDMLRTAATREVTEQ